MDGLVWFFQQAWAYVILALPIITGIAVPCLVQIARIYSNAKITMAGQKVQLSKINELTERLNISNKIIIDMNEERISLYIQLEASTVNKKQKAVYAKAIARLQEQTKELDNVGIETLQSVVVKKVKVKKK